MFLNLKFIQSVRSGGWTSKKPLTFFGEQNRLSNKFASRLSFFKRFLSNCRKNLQENLFRENLRNLYVFVRHNLHSQHPQIQLCPGSSRHRCDTTSATTRGFHLFRPNSGVIALLLVALIPIALIGLRYSQTFLSKKVPPLDKIDTTKLYKECAREAALAAAKTWNSLLTVSSQAKTVYDAANAVYNAHPCLQKSRTGASIPGLSEDGVALAPSLLKSQYPSKTHDCRRK